MENKEVIYQQDLTDEVAKFENRSSPTIHVEVEKGTYGPVISVYRHGSSDLLASVSLDYFNGRIAAICFPEGQLDADPTIVTLVETV